MKDIYLYDGISVLKNKLNIRDKDLLDEAEADYVTYRLKEIALNPLQGGYDYPHLLCMHGYIFQDLYDWAGQQRKINIYKEEPVLGGLSVDYSDVFDIAKDAERILSEMRKKAWPDMDTHEVAIEFSDSLAKLWRIHPFRDDGVIIRTSQLRQAKSRLALICPNFLSQMGHEVGRRRKIHTYELKSAGSVLRHRIRLRRLRGKIQRLGLLAVLKTAGVLFLL